MANAFLDSAKSLFGIGLLDAVKKRLKTFSQLRKTYGIHAIYRTSKNKRFSSTSAAYGLTGVPTSRPTKRPIKAVEEADRPEHATGHRLVEVRRDTLQPIWFAPNFKVSNNYCNKEFPYDPENAMKNCVTYKYIPKDRTSVRGKKIVFLDMCGRKFKHKNELGQEVELYKLDTHLMTLIYDKIMKNNQEFIFADDDGQEFIQIDNRYENIPTLKEFLSAYGYGHGNRHSDDDIDEFFVLEMFHLLIDELNIENLHLDGEAEAGCIFMGYYHGNILLEEDDAEIAIPYRNAINKNYMDFHGVVAKGNKRTIRESSERTYSSRSPQESPQLSKKSKKTIKIQPLKKKKGRLQKSSRSFSRKSNSL